MRPISLAVDVTNYVMLSTGQPLHAFDASYAGGRDLRPPRGAGEKLTTLDGVTRNLFTEDLLITRRGRGRDIACPRDRRSDGRRRRRVTATTDILVGLHFAAVSVGRSARRHKLV